MTLHASSLDRLVESQAKDLLALLQEHGPSTEGIFRLAAGERASRELREALDSGAPVQLESQPVHLLAAILKEFLRKIPSKLLQNELYEDWMSALQKTSRQERLAGLKDVKGFEYYKQALKSPVSDARGYPIKFKPYSLVRISPAPSGCSSSECNGCPGWASV
ncbi:hypothetical protein Q9966_007835 [Columba livia]|nr:hypothetical protein Q9966_007835 [Columba livia]